MAQLLSENEWVMVVCVNSVEVASRTWQALMAAIPDLIPSRIPELADASRVVGLGYN
jgi:hypothetical protein